MAYSSTPPPAFSDTTPTAHSIVTRIAVVTCTVLGLVALFVVLHLEAREHALRIEKKHAKASVMADLVAGAVAPDIGDTAALREQLENLRSARDLVYAAVWRSHVETPAVEFVAAAFPGLHLPKPPDENLELIEADHIDVIRQVRRPAEEVLGTVVLRVSLAAENTALSTATWQTSALALVIAAGVALVLVLAMRRAVILPLSRLAQAAQDLARGQQTQIDIVSGDEIGELSRLFNSMGEAIAIREEKIGAASRHLQGLLDHMRQAIVVFGPFGIIGNERSRLANELFGEHARPGCSILDLLYPEESTTPIERRAFDEWLQVALVDETDEWSAIADLAPKEVTLHKGGAQEITLELEFRRLDREGAVAMMLLATDATLRRKLERSVEEKEREHAAQIALMRRLLAGGAQTFVRFLETAARRLEASRELLGEAESCSGRLIEELFRDIHTLRTEARCFALAAAERELNALETQLSALRSEPDARSWDEIRKGLLHGLDAVERLLAEARTLFVAESPIGAAVLEQLPVRRADVVRLVELTRGRADEIETVALRIASRPFGECTVMMMESASRWAARAGKYVELSMLGKDVMIPEALSRVLAGVLSHLVKNSIAHGIELPEERERLGKLPTGAIEIRCAENAAGPIIEVCDDGAGFDLIALQREAKRHGISDENPLDLAFHAGVSTLSGNNYFLGGYGVGLSAVRTELAAIGYAVRVESAPNRGSTVRLWAGRAGN